MIDPAAHVRFAHSIAQRFIRSRNLPHHVWDDVHGDAIEGLCRAARDYDPARGVSFGAYAAPRIHGHIGDGLRRMDHLTRNQRRDASCEGAASLAPLSLEGLLEAAAGDGVPLVESSRSADIDAMLGLLDFRQLLRDMTDYLTFRQRQAVAVWLDDDMTATQLADINGISVSAVSQYKALALHKIRRHLVA